MNDAKSYSQILRSSFIIGGASVLNIVIALVRTKLAAVLIGPAGVGLIGVFQSLVATASSVAGLGFGNVGTRQIAEATAHGDGAAVASARRALALGTAGLAVGGALLFWAARGVLAERVLGDTNMASAVGWLALAVALTVAGGAQGALLNGMRRIGDIARISVFSAALSTLLGGAALLGWGRDGIWAFVVAVPLCSFLVGHWYVAKLPKVDAARSSPKALAGQWTTLVKLGFAFTLAGLVASLAQLLVRTLVARELGAGALGNFQAAWQISMTYLGFVLAAMGTDYYPRLTAVIRDDAAVNRMVNEQTEVVILLGGTVLLAMMGAAPWVIQLLYSAQFDQAAGLLRWQIIGDVFKILSWPLGFVLLAAGAGRVFVLAESVAYGLLSFLTWVGLPLIGLSATGVAFAGMYAAYLPLVYWLARRRSRFGWTGTIVRQALSLLCLCALIMLLAHWSEWAAAGAGAIVTAGWGAYALGQLAHHAGTAPRLQRLAQRLRPRA